MEIPKPGSAEWLAALNTIFWNPDRVGMAERLAPLLAGLTIENAQSVADLLEVVDEDVDPAAAWGMFLARYAALDGAAAWRCGLRSDLGKTGLLDALRVWHSRDPAAPERVIAEVEVGGDRAYQTRWLVQVKMEASPQSAAAWAAGLADSEMRKMAMRDVIRGVVRRENANFPTWAGWLASYSALPDSAPAAGELVAAWVRTDGVSAGAWALSLPDGPVRSRALLDLVGQWTSLDRQAAGNWLNANREKGGLDSAVAAYSELFVYESPSTAFAWANSIEDSGLRAATLERLHSYGPR